MKIDILTYVYHPRCNRCHKKVKLTPDNKWHRCPECGMKLRTRPTSQCWKKIRDRKEAAGLLKRY